jgi:circadian clock protein KaiB
MTHPAKYKFRFYVAGDTQNSVDALANLKALCQANFPERFELEIVDVFREPKRASADGILMTPTLMVLAPAPMKKIVGTLSQSQVVLRALGLSVQPA